MQRDSKDIYIFDSINDNGLVVLLKNNDNSDYGFLKDKNYLFLNYEGVVDGGKYIKKNSDIRLEGWYNKVIFKYDKRGNYSNIADVFVEICNKSDINISSSEILKEFIKYFEIERKLTIKNNEKFIGDFGEALFIYKCIQLNLKEEIKSSLFKKDDEDRFDFNFDNNSIELKTTTYRTSEIKLNNRQVPNSTNKFLSVCKLNIEKNKFDQNYLNINDVYNLINQEIGNTNFIDLKIDYYKNYDESTELFVNINEVNFCFFKQDFIPKISVTNSNSLKDIILCLDVTNSLELTSEFNNKLISIVKNKNFTNKC